MNIVSFSGGKDSTAMLLMMIEKGIKIDRIVYVDTTKEFPQMYDHIEKVQTMIEPLKIEIVKIDFDYYLGEHNVNVRNGSKNDIGYGWPSFHNRWCTSFKTQLSKKALKNENGYAKYIGIAFDEQQRAGKNKKGEILKYPLIEWGITEKQALEYCYSKGFDWGGLYEKFVRVSCCLCPLQRLGELKTVYNEFPELWEDMRRLDNMSWRKFRSDYSLQELEQKFDRENEEGKVKHLEDTVDGQTVLL
jgi:3'-phosphoadenosine 5'-phosphosulfate sulfotransferase (PAPS reductase)/FAD synthetase